MWRFIREFTQVSAFHAARITIRMQNAKYSPCFWPKEHENWQDGLVDLGTSRIDFDMPLIAIDS